MTKESDGRSVTVMRNVRHDWHLVERQVGQRAIDRKEWRRWMCTGQCLSEVRSKVRLWRWRWWWWWRNEP